jgi:hypothetical protein
MTKIKVGASPRPSLAVKNESHPVGAQSVPPANDNEAVLAADEAANDNQAPVAAREAANDNQAVVAVHRAPNDNQATAATHVAIDDGIGIRVTDDLPRPLPVLPGEGEIVRKLLGTRFRQILFGDNQ